MNNVIENGLGLICELPPLLFMSKVGSCIARCGGFAKRRAVYTPTRDLRGWNQLAFVRSSKTDIRRWSQLQNVTRPFLFSRGMQDNRKYLHESLGVDQ